VASDNTNQFIIGADAALRSRRRRRLSRHERFSLCVVARPAQLIFDQDPGDLLVVVNAGNVVAAMTLASLEYAVTYLGVPLLMVLGHSNCWAVGMAEASKDFVRRTFGDFEFRKFRLYLWGATYEFLHRNLDCYRLILSKPKQSSA
jgi:Carbonic anhydrase